LLEVLIKEELAVTVTNFACKYAAFKKEIAMKNRFGILLRLARRKAEKTLQELGAYVGVTAAHLSKVERGVVSPPRDHVIVRIAEFLGIRPDALLRAAAVERDTMSILRPQTVEAYTFLLRRLNTLTDNELATITAILEGTSGAPNRQVSSSGDDSTLPESCESEDLEQIQESSSSRARSQEMLAGGTEGSASTQWGTGGNQYEKEQRDPERRRRDEYANGGGASGDNLRRLPANRS
jgi:transcriptional regulator with XRE-family HTH domain